MLAIGLRLYQHHLLGKAIRSIGLFGITIPNGIFFEGHRCEFGIGTYSTCGNKLAHAMLIGMVHEFHTHDHIVVKKFSGMLAVRTDAADHGGEMDDHVRASVVERAGDVGRQAQIVVSASRDEDLRSSRLLEPSDDGLAEEAAAAGHHHPAVTPVQIARQ